MIQLQEFPGGISETRRAELWAIDAQMRPASQLIQYLDRENATKGRFARLTRDTLGAG